MYEKYPGSINDVSQLQFMVEKVKGYRYKNIGFIIVLRKLQRNGQDWKKVFRKCRVI